MDTKRRAHFTRSILAELKRCGELVEAGNEVPDFELSEVSQMFVMDPLSTTDVIDVSNGLDIAAGGALLFLYRMFIQHMDRSIELTDKLFKCSTYNLFSFLENVAFKTDRWDPILKSVPVDHELLAILACHICRGVPDDTPTGVWAAPYAEEMAKGPKIPNSDIDMSALVDSGKYVDDRSARRAWFFKKIWNPDTMATTTYGLVLARKAIRQFYYYEARLKPLFEGAVPSHGIERTFRSVGDFTKGKSKECAKIYDQIRSWSRESAAAEIYGTNRHRNELSDAYCSSSVSEYFKGRDSLVPEDPGVTWTTKRAMCDYSDLAMYMYNILGVPPDALMSPAPQLKDMSSQVGVLRDPIDCLNRSEKLGLERWTDDSVYQAELVRYVGMFMASILSSYFESKDLPYRLYLCTGEESIVTNRDRVEKDVTEGPAERKDPCKASAMFYGIGTRWYMYMAMQGVVQGEEGLEPDGVQREYTLIESNVIQRLVVVFIMRTGILDMIVS